MAVQPGPIGTVISRLADERPDAPALTVGSRTLTRRELDVRTNRLASRLGRQGARAQSIVAVVLPNSIELVEAILAAWKLGATPLVLPSKMPMHERAAVLELAAPSLVVDNPQQVIGIDGNGEEPDDAPLAPVVARWWRASTSGGSTGRPKLVLSTRPGTADPDERTLLLRRDGAIVIPGPLYHGAPFLFATTGLWRGKHVVLLDRFDPAATLRAVSEYHADYLMLVPTMMKRIWQLPDEVKRAADLSALRTVLHLGSACPVWLKEAWIEWLGPDRIHELYAGTEGQATTWITGQEWLQHRGSVGRPVGGAVMQAFDPDSDRPLPPGEVGEIFMRPVEDAAPTYQYVGADARKRGRWESLGDMGWVDADGYVYIVDRRVDMIVTGGSNVYPAEVEMALEEHPDVDAVVVVGLPDDDLGHRVHAIVEASQALEANELAAFLAERLVRYKIPRTFEFVDTPLRDEAGKVRRALLRDQRMDRAGPGPSVRPD